MYKVAPEWGPLVGEHISLYINIYIIGRNWISYSQCRYEMKVTPFIGNFSLISTCHYNEWVVIDPYPTVITFDRWGWAPQTNIIISRRERVKRPGKYFIRKWALGLHHSVKNTNLPSKKNTSNKTYNKEKTFISAPSWSHVYLFLQPNWKCKSNRKIINAVMIPLLFFLLSFIWYLVLVLFSTPSWCMPKRQTVFRHLMDHDLNHDA